jgi:hypothetical protein
LLTHTPVQVTVGLDTDHQRTESGGRMPLPVVVAIGCEAILLLMNAIGTVIAVPGGDHHVLISTGIRSGVELGAIIGYARGANIVRRVSIVLTSVSLLFYLIVGTLLVVFGLYLIWKSGIPGKDMIMVGALLHAASVLYIMLYGVIIACLLSPSARAYFQARTSRRQPPRLQYSET